MDIRDLFREAILDVITWPVISHLLSASLRLIERYTFGQASHINLVSKGFKSYFSSFRQATYSYFSNGIDPLFLRSSSSQPVKTSSPKTILYAGNIGNGQGLHTLVPQVALALGDTYRFKIIGDGGARQKLEKALQANRITTVDLFPPLHRQELLSAYYQADYLLVHLNNWASCQRVLPSKLFEYGATDKPILAGVAGYAADFVCEHLPNAFVFEPGNRESLIRLLREVPHRTKTRWAFKRRFSRQTINQQMAQLIRCVSTKIP